MPLPHSLSEVTLADVAVSILVAGALAIVVRTSSNITRAKSEQKPAKRQRRRKKATRAEENSAEEQRDTATVVAHSAEPSAGKARAKAENTSVSAQEAPGSYPDDESKLAPKSIQVPSASPGAATPPVPKQESKSKKSKNKKASQPPPLDGKTLAERLQPPRPPTQVDDMIDREIEPEPVTARVMRVVEPEEPETLEYSDPEEGWNQVRRSSEFSALFKGLDAPLLIPRYLQSRNRDLGQPRPFHPRRLDRPGSWGQRMRPPRSSGRTKTRPWLPKKPKTLPRKSGKPSLRRTNVLNSRSSIEPASAR
jgi:hypothetical protein